MKDLITSCLNEPQMEAVTGLEQYLLILAGAGSGKTRVLVHRIAWLIQTMGVSPYAILAVTFTNKAAAEMRGRIEEMLRAPMSGMWVGTFHGLAHRLLRAHWQEAGLTQTFQVLDSEDQHRLIRRIMKSMNLDETKWPSKQAQWYINNQKDQALRAKDIRSDGHVFTETMLRIYKEYEELCERLGLVDFAELLIRSYETLQKNPALLHHYQQRFQHILVDEFQDTNGVQYAWLKLFTSPQSSLMAVGDDDQSIYSWRGAKVEHILQFSKDFPGVKTIRLEQNYRSTRNILEAANAIISKNHNRLGKELWTSGPQGEMISVYGGFNDIDEARFVVDSISGWLSQGGTRGEVAVLYRSNAQSRVIEEQLIRANVPYRVYGGLKFFERAEVKDALAYLRLVENPHDDGAFERVVNTPTRGIGQQTVEILRDCARLEHLSLWQSVHYLLKNDHLSPRAASALQHFIEIIKSLTETAKTENLADLTEAAIQKSGLYDFYGKDQSEKGRSRLENLEELVNATQQFSPEDYELESASPLTTFLAHVALETGEHQSHDISDCVHLMTLHSAKGLEFPLVFLTGLEEGLFPHQMSSQDAQQLEEERRLCYVGMTRAKQKLYLTYAESRRLHGHESYQKPSRFLQEVPGELLEEVRMKAKISRPMSFSSYVEPDFSDEQGFQLGQRVRHAKFGEGTIMNYEGQGDTARVQVKFTRHGVKWLVATYAKLEPV